MLLFLLSIVGISLSGVMMPGPMFAVTLAKSYESRYAGTLIAIGHAIVEVPLMLLVYFGFAAFFKSEGVKVALSIVGGIVLIYLGVSMLRVRLQVAEKRRNLPYNSVVAGITTSIFNPYFLLWWATIGTGLIAKSTTFGQVGFLLLIPAHWLCDLIWLSFVSVVVHKSGHLWSKRTHSLVVTGCSLLLIGFGIWFISSSLPVG